MINRRDVERGLGPLIFQLRGLVFTLCAKLRVNKMSELINFREKNGIFFSSLGFLNYDRVTYVPQNCHT